jgi:hypothetical protein
MSDMVLFDAPSLVDPHLFGRLDRVPAVCWRVSDHGRRGREVCVHVRPGVNMARDVGGVAAAVAKSCSAMKRPDVNRLTSPENGHAGGTRPAC